jgi:hypothetical protein
LFRRGGLFLPPCDDSFLPAAAAMVASISPFAWRWPSWFLRSCDLRRRVDLLPDATCLPTASSTTPSGADAECRRPSLELAQRRRPDDPELRLLSPSLLSLASSSRPSSHRTLSRDAAARHGHPVAPHGEAPSVSAG